MSAPTVLAVVPLAGSDPEFRGGLVPKLAGRSLLAYTHRAFAECARVDRVILSTDSEAVAKAARRDGWDVPFLRPSTLGNPETGITDVLRHAVEWFGTREEYLPDWVLMGTVTYPFRPAGFVERFIETVMARDLDSAVAVVQERQAHWMVDDDGTPQLVTYGGHTPKAQKRTVYRELSGLVSLVRREVIRSGRLYGDRLGVIPVQDSMACVNIHDANGWALAELLAPHGRRAPAGTASRRKVSHGR